MTKTKTDYLVKAFAMDDSIDRSHARQAHVSKFMADNEEQAGKLCSALLGLQTLNGKIYLVEVWTTEADPTLVTTFEDFEQEVK